jgi:hypothetical protein
MSFLQIQSAPTDYAGARQQKINGSLQEDIQSPQERLQNNQEDLQSFPAPPRTFHK